MVEELPLAIQYGMPIKEFWDEDESLFYAYQKAYINNLHQTSHINALYFKIGIELGIANLFKGKNDKYIEFPSEDFYNPFNNEKEENAKSFIEKFDTSKNNNELYQLKKKIEERRIKDGRQL